MTTLAEYNNNPGNIRPAKGVKYDGLLGVDDKGFGIFATPEDGQKALIGDLTHKLGKRGIKTPSDFVDAYSPAGEENPEDSRDNYKIYIAQKLGLKSTDAPFPEDAVQQLAQAVTAFEGGTWAQPRDEKPSVAVPELPPPADVDETTPESDQGKRTEVLSPAIGAALGATAGVGLGGSAAVLQGKIDAAKEAYDIFTSRNASSAPGSATTRTGETPGGKWGAKTGYGMGEGTVQESSSRYQRAVPKGKVSGAQAKTWGPAMPGESPDIVQRMIDRAKAAEAASLAQQAEMAAASKTSPLLSYAKRLAAMPVKGGLAGAGLGFGAVDAMNRYNQGDKTGAAIGGLGTAAGLAAGFVPSMGALPAAGMAAPLYLTASDRIEYLKKHPEMIQLQEDEYDAMGNRQR